MPDNTSPERHRIYGQDGEPLAPPEGIDPVEQYRLLAHELQECYPDAEARHLDLLVAREMRTYCGYNAEAITRAMLEASLYLASGNDSNPRDYVDGTVDEAMQEDPTQNTGIGWG
jgi:hypothetical protein